jgi:hypothetical protein
VGKLIQADKKTLEIVGAVSQMLLDDMAAMADLRVELSEQSGFSRGRDVGFEEGYRACQRDIQSSLLLFHQAAGFNLIPRMEKE